MLHFIHLVFALIVKCRKQQWQSTEKVNKSALSWLTFPSSFTGFPEAESAVDEDGNDDDAVFVEEGRNYGKICDAETEERLEIIASVFPLTGRPFSALNRQLLPKYFEQPQELFVFASSFP